MSCDGKDDWELLHAYSNGRSEAAFTKIVERHLGFVYSTALRHVRDQHLAEDVCQAVFIVLARKAHTMKKRGILSSWLFRTVRYAASDVLKREARRKHRELVASTDGSGDPEPVSEPQQVALRLDEALASLNEMDRRAVLLRYFEQKSVREVGEVFSIQEEAAKKRITRAVDKLRTYLARTGTTVTSALLLAAIASESSRGAPLGLATSIVSGVTGASGAMAASSSGLAGAILNWMLLGKLKLAGLVLIALAVPIVGVLVFRESSPAASYDLGRGFSLDGNPNGVWSYGSKEFPEGELTLQSYARREVVDSWSYRAGVWPAIYHNYTTNTLVFDRGRGVYPPGAVWMAAGENGTRRNFAAIRFTVPKTGSDVYRVESRVRFGLSEPVASDADFRLVHNGIQLFWVNHPAGSKDWVGYTNKMTLQAGDTIDLLVGRGDDGWQPGSVLIIECRITSLPIGSKAASGSSANVRRTSSGADGRRTDGARSSFGGLRASSLALDRRPPKAVETLGGITLAYEPAPTAAAVLGLSLPDSHSQVTLTN